MAVSLQPGGWMKVYIVAVQRPNSQLIFVDNTGDQRGHVYNLGMAQQYVSEHAARLEAIDQQAEEVGAEVWVERITRERLE